jgi:hypothetical protein
LETIASECGALPSSLRAALYSGECYLRLGDFEAAFGFYGKVVDLMLEGRQKYFERLAAGETQTPPPTLLSISR